MCEQNKIKETKIVNLIPFHHIHNNISKLKKLYLILHLFAFVVFLVDVSKCASNGVSVEETFAQIVIAWIGPAAVRRSKFTNGIIHSRKSKL